VLIYFAAAAGAYPFQISITKTYNVTNLLEDLKSIYRIAGLKGQPVAFIFTCAQAPASKPLSR
jgi:dynein heavy chain